MTTIIYGASVGTDAIAYPISNFVGFDPSVWEELDTSIDKKTGDSETVFRLIQGDPAYPVTQRLAHYPKAEHDNCSLKFSSWTEKTVGTEVTIKPFTLTTSWRSEEGPVPDEAWMLQALMLQLSFLLPDIAAGAVTAGFLGKLAYGKTSNDLANVTRT